LIDFSGEARGKQSAGFWLSPYKRYQKYGIVNSEAKPARRWVVRVQVNDKFVVASPASKGRKKPVLGLHIRAPDYESGGQEFESLRARQQNQRSFLLRQLGPISGWGCTSGRTINSSAPSAADNLPTSRGICTTALGPRRGDDPWIVPSSAREHRSCVAHLTEVTRFRCDKEFVVQREVTRPRWFERGTMPADAWEAIRGELDPIDKNTDTEPI
jgi:hypothetical protein